MRRLKIQRTCRFIYLKIDHCLYLRYSIGCVKKKWYMTGEKKGHVKMGDIKVLVN